jgi:hypothetical protein
MATIEILSTTLSSRVSSSDRSDSSIEFYPDSISSSSSSDPSDSQKSDHSNSILVTTKNCDICFEGIGDGDGDGDDDGNSFLSRCPYSSICFSCLRSYLESKINDSQIFSNGNIKCYCSQHQCGHDLNPTEILLILSSSSFSSMRTTRPRNENNDPLDSVQNLQQSDDLVENVQQSDDLVKKYHRFHQNILVTLDPTKSWCPLPNCGGIATLLQPSVAAATAVTTAATAVTTAASYRHEAQCELCQFRFCTQCLKDHSTTWSSVVCSLSSLPSSGQKSNSAAEDKSIQKWKSNHGGVSRKCPQCRHHIEKNGGCNHMTCTFCKHEFCWCCKSTYHPQGGCSAGKMCRLLALNKNHRWGSSFLTRTCTKSLAFPVVVSVACVGVGLGTSVAAVSAVTILPYLGIKKFHKYLTKDDPDDFPMERHHRPPFSRSPASRHLDVSFSDVDGSFDDDDYEYGSRLSWKEEEESSFSDLDL